MHGFQTAGHKRLEESGDKRLYTKKVRLPPAHLTRGMTLSRHFDLIDSLKYFDNYKNHYRKINDINALHPLHTHLMFGDKSCEDSYWLASVSNGYESIVLLINATFCLSMEFEKFNKNDLLSLRVFCVEVLQFPLFRAAKLFHWIKVQVLPP